MAMEAEDAMRRVSTEPTVSVDEAARLLGIGRSTVYAAVKSGEVPSIRVRTRVRIPSNWMRRELGLDSDRESGDMV